MKYQPLMHGGTINPIVTHIQGHGPIPTDELLN